MNSWLYPDNTTINFTIDNNTFERYDYNFFRDLMLYTFIFWIFGHFLEEFEEHLRRPINENDYDDLAFDFLTI